MLDFNMSGQCGIEFIDVMNHHPKAKLQNMIKIVFSLSRGCIYVESVLSYAWNLQRISLYTPPMRVTFPEAMHIQIS